MLSLANSSVEQGCASALRKLPEKRDQIKVEDQEPDPEYCDENLRLELVVLLVKDARGA